MVTFTTAAVGLLLHAGASGVRADVFRRIYDVFLWLGLAVGAVVILYMVYNAYRYREGGGHVDGDRDRPQLGEVPQGGGGGRKLFLSFGLSTIIVVSLIGWTYGSLLFVEQKPAQSEDVLEVRVVGYQFGWEFVYPNGHTTRGELRVPAGRTVKLVVTSKDVFHNFGVPGLRVKADAIPGQTTDTWIQTNQTGTYQAQCYELCGRGHSYMTATVHVMEPAAFDAWYANTTASNATTGNATTNASATTDAANATTSADVATTRSA